MAAPTQFFASELQCIWHLANCDRSDVLRSVGASVPAETLNHASIQMSEASYASHPEPIYVTKMLGQTPAKQAMYSLHRQNVTEGGTSFESCLQ